MRENYKFPITKWLSSRLLIVVAMLIIAPLIPVPENGVYATFSLDILSAWDSSWYEKIATSGYDFSSDVKQIHTVAFFLYFHY